MPPQALRRGVRPWLLLRSGLLGVLLPRGEVEGLVVLDLSLETIHVAVENLNWKKLKQLFAN